MLVWVLYINWYEILLSYLMLTLIDDIFDLNQNKMNMGNIEWMLAWYLKINLYQFLQSKPIKQSFTYLVLALELGKVKEVLPKCKWKKWISELLSECFYGSFTFIYIEFYYSRNVGIYYWFINFISLFNLDIMIVLRFTNINIVFGFGVLCSHS